MKFNNYDLSIMKIEKLLEKFNTSKNGLNLSDVEKHQEEYGRNEIEYKKDKSVFQIIVEAFLSPFTLVLLALAFISFATEYLLVAKSEKDLTSAIIIITLEIGRASCRERV